MNNVIWSVHKLYNPVKNSFVFRVITLFVIALFVTLLDSKLSAKPALPDTPMSYSEMETLIQQLQEKSFISVETITQTVQGRNVYLVHVDPDPNKSAWRLFFIGQQHGDEPAGKDALLHWLRRIAEKPSLISRDTDIWMVPMTNPDGAEANTRRNGNDADLNRDHTLLVQPETRAIHEQVRKIQPHVIVDCHEFTRDSEDYLKNGWLEWPLIMMDTANNPNFTDGIYSTGKWFCETVSPKMQKAGVNYTRYYVGGTPPNEELRYSSPEIDDARNGLASYGGLGFIIESGVNRDRKNPNDNLSERVRAYNLLFDEFAGNQEFRTRGLKVVKNSRSAQLPKYISTNYFWGNVGMQTHLVKVRDAHTNKTLEIETLNFMTDMIVKKSITRPIGYLIDAKSAERYRPLLESQDIDFDVLSKPTSYVVESCSLITIENSWDPVYSRYAGRQIVEQRNTALKSFQQGAIYIPVSKPNDRRDFILFEPTMLYGMYQYQHYFDTIDGATQIPVYRVMQNAQ